MIQSLTYGSEVNGMDIKFIETNGQIEFIDIQLHLHGATQPIKDLTDAMKAHLTDYCLSESVRLAKYRSLEIDFKERLGDNVIIDNDRTYIECLKEFESRTKGCDDMHDLNSGLNSF